VKPWLRSPGRMAIPPGSSMGALRVRSGRGPTFRTAPRGAKSGRMKHATGFTCPSRSDHQDLRVPEPLVASALSPDIPLGPACRSPLKRGVPARLLQARGTKIGTREDLASAFISSGYGIPPWSGCGYLSLSVRGFYLAPSTKCGHVNPHGRATRPWYPGSV
jgi:hypothetical protein